MAEPGTVIGGKYRLERLIGEGGTATVWRALHTDLGRAVAVKFIHASGPSAAQTAQRFLREARVAASVRHRNIVDILDVGIQDERQPYMVMELLEGQSLESRLGQGPPLTLEQAIAIVSLSLRGLVAVHEAGIVHRDLKPENIYLVSDTEGAYPKLLDFGISRLLYSRDPNDPRSQVYTTEGLIVGTPRYMSPEQARGLPDIDRTTDIYSMGVILYEVLAGRCPFEADHIGDLIVKITTEDPVPIQVLCPDLDPRLADVVMTAIRRDRTQRYQTAREMREAIAQAVDASGRASMPGLGSLALRVSDSAIPAAPAAASGAPVSLPFRSAPTLELEPQAAPEPEPEPEPAPEPELLDDLPGERTHADAEAPFSDTTAETPILAPGPVLAAALDAVPEARRPDAVSAPPGRSALRFAGAVGGAAVLGAIVYMIAAGRGAGDAPALGAGRTPNAALAVPTPVARPVGDLVLVELRGAPADATLRVDGVYQPLGPVRLPRSERVHRIEVLSEGRDPWVVEHRATEGRAYEVGELPAGELPPSDVRPAGRAAGTKRGGPAPSPSGDPPRRADDPPRPRPSRPPAAEEPLELPTLPSIR